MPESNNLTNSSVLKKRVLIVADDMATFLKDFIMAGGFEANSITSYGNLDKVYAELTRLEYDMIIPTNNSLRPGDILTLVPEIKHRFPRIRILVISGHMLPEFVSKIQEFRIDALFPMPCDLNKLVLRIKELLRG